MARKTALNTSVKVIVKFPALELTFSQVDKVLSTKTLSQIDYYLIMSVRLWNFKDGGSLKASFLPKNQHAQRKF